MNCNHVHALVTPYVDGELELRQSTAIERHLRGCAGCTASCREMNALRTRIRTQVPRFVASPQLQARVRAMAGAMRAAETSHTPREGDRRRWLAGGAFAGGLAMVVAWVFGTAVMTSVASADFAVSAVASHIDATLGDRLIQVASSDRHTVKPWLSARLDYSPPVNDLADEGFPLVGGRLAQIDRRPIATLVYRYGQHTIDVFVRPDRVLTPTTSRTVRGFNVARAQGATMDWCAVSDAEPEVLAAFVKQLAARDGAP